MGPYAAGNVWKRTCEYWDTPSKTLHFQYFADPGPAKDGDTIRYEYNQSGVWIGCLNDNGDYMTSQFYASGNREFNIYYTAAGIEKRRIEYWDNPSAIMRYQYFPDAHPASSGDAVKYEYTETGRRLKVTYDDDRLNTYYNDASNRLKSTTLSVPDASGGVYYEYFNENWNNRGYGRLHYSRLKTPNASGELSFKRS